MAARRLVDVLSSLRTQGVRRDDSKLFDRRVNKSARECAEILALAGALRNAHREQDLRRIGAEEGAGPAAPEKLADRARERRHAGLRAHRETEAEAVAGGHQRALDLDVGAEMIGGHQIQRLAADDPAAVERAAI